MDFGAQLVTDLNTQLGDPVARLPPGFASDLPVRTLSEHLENLGRQAFDNAVTGYDTVRFKVTSSERSKVFDLVSVVFQKPDSRVSCCLLYTSPSPRDRG